MTDERSKGTGWVTEVPVGSIRFKGKNQGFIEVKGHRSQVEKGDRWSYLQ